MDFWIAVFSSPFGYIWIPAMFLMTVFIGVGESGDEPWFLFPVFFLFLLTIACLLAWLGWSFAKAWGAV